MPAWEAFLHTHPSFHHGILENHKLTFWIVGGFLSAVYWVNWGSLCFEGGVPPCKLPHLHAGMCVESLAIRGHLCFFTDIGRWVPFLLLLVYLECLSDLFFFSSQESAPQLSVVFYSSVSLISAHWHVSSSLIQVYFVPFSLRQCRLMVWDYSSFLTWASNMAGPSQNTSAESHRCCILTLIHVCDFSLEHHWYFLFGPWIVILGVLHVFQVFSDF